MAKYRSLKIRKHLRLQKIFQPFCNCWVRWDRCCSSEKGSIKSIVGSRKLIRSIHYVCTVFLLLQIIIGFLALPNFKCFGKKIHFFFNIFFHSLFFRFLGLVNHDCKISTWIFCILGHNNPNFFSHINNIAWVQMVAISFSEYTLYSISTNYIVSKLKHCAKNTHCHISPDL